MGRQMFIKQISNNMKTASQREELKKTAYLGDCCLDAETGDLYVFDGQDFIKHDSNNQPTYNIEIEAGDV